MAATDLRVHLGEALRRLDKEDIIIEKGGVPVAVLKRYTPDERRPSAGSVYDAYERTLSKKADSSAWPRAFAAMRKGWAGVDVDKLIADIHRWREEGSRPPVSLDD